MTLYWTKFTQLRILNQPCGVGNFYIRASDDACYTNRHFVPKFEAALSAGEWTFFTQLRFYRNAVAAEEHCSECLRSGAKSSFARFKPVALYWAKFTQLRF